MGELNVMGRVAPVNNRRAACQAAPQRESRLRFRVLADWECRSGTLNKGVEAMEVHPARPQGFEEEARFVEAVKRGEEALRRGESLTHEEVGQRLRRFLEH